MSNVECRWPPSIAPARKPRGHGPWGRSVVYLDADTARDQVRAPLSTGYTDLAVLGPVVRPATYAYAAVYVKRGGTTPLLWDSALYSTPAIAIRAGPQSAKIIGVGVCVARLDALACRSTV